MNGATRPHEAAPGTIRGDFALETAQNLVHASDSPETAADRDRPLVRGRRAPRLRPRDRSLGARPGRLTVDGAPGLAGCSGRHAGARRCPRSALGRPTADDPRGARPDLIAARAPPTVVEPRPPTAIARPTTQPGRRPPRRVGRDSPGWPPGRAGPAKGRRPSRRRASPEAGTPRWLAARTGAAIASTPLTRRRPSTTRGAKTVTRTRTPIGPGRPVE